MISLIIGTVFVIGLVVCLAVAFAEGAKEKRELALRSAIEVRGIERRTEAAHTKQAMRQEAAQVRRELTAELRQLDRGKS